MRSTVALEAKQNGRERNNLKGTKFEDTSMFFLPGMASISACQVL